MLKQRDEPIPRQYFTFPSERDKQIRPEEMARRSRLLRLGVYLKSSAAVFPPNSTAVTLLLSTSTSEAAAFEGS